MALEGRERPRRKGQGCESGSCRQAGAYVWPALPFPSALSRLDIFWPWVRRDILSLPFNGCFFFQGKPAVVHPSLRDPRSQKQLPGLQSFATARSCCALLAAYQPPQAGAKGTTGVFRSESHRPRVAAGLQQLDADVTTSSKSLSRHKPGRCFRMHCAAALAPSLEKE